MRGRALIRRLFPYVVIAVLGFTLAYVVMFTFVLPSKVLPSSQQLHAQRDADSVDTALVPRGSPGQVVDSTVAGSAGGGGLAPPISLTAPPPVLEPIDVPDVTGMLLADGRGVLNGVQLTTVVQFDTSSTQIPGTILRQSPAAGVKVNIHGGVTLIVSRLPGDSTTDSSTRHGAPLPQIQPEPDTSPDSLSRSSAAHDSASTDSAAHTTTTTSP